jgi:HEXXH motif-containing protein
MTGQHLVLCDRSGSDPHVFRGAYARHLAGWMKQFVALGPQFPAELHAVHHSMDQLVRRAVLKDAAAILHCFASPAVGTPLRCLAMRDELPEFRARIDATVAAMMPQLLFEMGLEGLIGEDDTLLWEHGAPRLSSQRIGGQMIPPAGADGLLFSATHVAALSHGAEIARLPFHRDGMVAAIEAPGGFRYEAQYWALHGVTYFATVDHNPIAAFETHPDKSGNPVDLGGRSKEEWIEGLDAAFSLVESCLPATFDEMRLMLHEVIPVGWDEKRHLSASYREAIGTAYLTLHPNVMTMTEAVVHEFQHNKFNVAAESVEFLTNAFHPLYPSPVRPDPRPLWGILLAVHAFLPVAELYRRLRDAGHPLAAHAEFDRRMSELDLKNHEGMEMLRAHAQLTPPGLELFADLEDLERRHLAERTARGLPNVPTEVHVA